MSPGDFHIGSWSWRNMVYICFNVLFFSLFCIHSEENAPYSSYLNINFTWNHLNLIKCGYFKQEACRRFWFKTTRPQAPQNIIEVCLGESSLGDTISLWGPLSSHVSLGSFKPNFIGHDDLCSVVGEEGGLGSYKCRIVGGHNGPGHHLSSGRYPSLAPAIGVGIRVPDGELLAERHTQEEETSSVSSYRMKGLYLRSIVQG